MSANNYIRITKQGEKYIVSELDADTASAFGLRLEKNTLEEAIEAANTYMEENEVEYGLDIRL